MLEVKKGVGYTFVSCASCLTKSCMYFNPPSLVLKARVPIMPKAILAGPSNDAALQYFKLLLCVSMVALILMIYSIHS